MLSDTLEIERDVVVTFARDVTPLVRYRSSDLFTWHFIGRVEPMRWLWKETSGKVRLDVTVVAPGILPRSVHKNSLVVVRGAAEASDQISQYWSGAPVDGKTRRILKFQPCIGLHLAR